MTLIAISVRSDHAEFVTDTAAYKRNLAGTVDRVAKSIVLHHIDAAVLCAGSQWFGASARSVLHWASRELDYDGLVREAPGLLREIRDTEAPDGLDFSSAVFLVGHSVTDDQFVGYRLIDANDFEPRRLEGLYLAPTPFENRPQQSELDDFLADYEGSGEVAQAKDIAERWGRMPEYPRPTNLDQWVGLAHLVRVARSLQEFAKVPIAGSAYLTRLTCDSSHTVKILDYDDEGEEFMELVGFTQHPLAQKRDCHCGSGNAFLDCHLADQLDQPCGCGSQALFRDCCMVST